MSMNLLIVLFLFSDVSSQPQNYSSVAISIEAKKAEMLPPNANAKQMAVVKAFQHAWNGYKQFAWGHDELRPISQTYDDPFGLGLTIIDSLDTAIIMGLKNETEEALAWIRNDLNFDLDKNVNVFETTIRVLGGLLSGYHLTGEKFLVEKAEQLANRLLPAFTESQNSIPFSDINLQKGGPHSPNSGLSSLAEIATLQLEFRDLSRITGNAKYEQIAFATSQHIHNLTNGEYGGLFPYHLSQNGEFLNTVITLGARADSYYEYLLKQWIQTGKSIDWLLEDYVQAMKSVERHLWRTTSPNGYFIVGEKNGDSFIPKMDHLVCFLAGTLSLSSYYNISKTTHLEMAKELAETCHLMYENPTGLGPEIIHANLESRNGTVKEDIYVKKRDSHSLLRPEAIEAWFYLYRITGDKKYQEWGWDAFKSIEKFAKVESGGYSSIKSVLDSKNIERINKMESFFLAETLKYLYLLFSEDQSILSLDEWVFNTEAHPLPIYGS